MWSKETILVEAINEYGSHNQIIVAVEELSELQKECTKFLRGIGNRDNLVEELADVEIMIEQLKIIFNVDDEEIIKQSKKKINRLFDRLCASRQMGTNENETRENI